MRPDPFPSSGRDGEPDGSAASPGAGSGPEAGNRGSSVPRDEDPGSSVPRDEDPGSCVPPFPEDSEQGLFVCLPAEDLDVARFAQHGESDSMPPGPLLASVVHALAGDDGGGLAALSDDQLVGVIAATRRLESRIAWTQLAALREFAARRPANPAGRDGGRPRFTQPCEFAADELASELNLTWQSAAGHIAYACAVADRLPRTFAALAEGLIHPVHARIIEDETSILSPHDAAVADQELAGKAGPLTYGQLRSCAHRLILKLDPDAARRRKETARQDAHVRRFREDSGNAGMVARELPPDEVLASWQHVEQRALDLRAAGLPGTLQELRVRAYLDLLQERDSRTAPAAPESGQDGARGPARSSADGEPDGRHDGNGGPGGSEGPEDGNGGPGGSEGPEDGNGGPGGSEGPEDGNGSSGCAHTARTDVGPSVAALVNITVPWSTAVGQSEMPAEAVGLGLFDAQAARDLVAAAARHPRTRWCVTALYPDGTAAAHGCAVGPHSMPAQGQHAADFLRTLGITLNMIIRGPCNHAQAEHRYRPSRALRHLVNARNARCTAPGCGQAAGRCDLDHTKPWHQGGITCPCDLAPLCRHHHRCKQAEGWWLDQPEPGVLIWRVPSGRTYATAPTEYLI